MTTEELDYIVKIIEALFYTLTGTVALLTYLSARKTVLQPIKAEVFKKQVEVFTSIMELFNGKSEYRIRNTFGFDKMLSANIVNLLDDYARVFFSININPDDRPYNKKDCPSSIIIADVADRYITPIVPVSNDDQIEQTPQPTITKEEFWSNYIYGEICLPFSTSEMIKKLDEIMKSPFLTAESIRLLANIKETIEENILKIGEVLTIVAKDLPKICPDIDSLKRLSIESIEYKYNEAFILIEPYCSELTDYLRKYFKVESIMK